MGAISDKYGVLSDNEETNNVQLQEEISADESN